MVFSSPFSAATFPIKVTSYRQQAKKEARSIKKKFDPFRIRIQKILVLVKTNFCRKTSRRVVFISQRMCRQPFKRPRIAQPRRFTILCHAFCNLFVRRKGERRSIELLVMSVHSCNAGSLVPAPPAYDEREFCTSRYACHTFFARTKAKRCLPCAYVHAANCLSDVCPFCFFAGRCGNSDKRRRTVSGESRIPKRLSSATRYLFRNSMRHTHTHTRTNAAPRCHRAQPCCGHQKRQLAAVFLVKLLRHVLLLFVCPKVRTSALSARSHASKTLWLRHRHDPPAFERTAPCALTSDGLVAAKRRISFFYVPLLVRFPHLSLLSATHHALFAVGWHVPYVQGTAPSIYSGHTHTHVPAWLWL
jgi:hypothetical protein